MPPGVEPGVALPRRCGLWVGETGDAEEKRATRAKLACIPWEYSILHRRHTHDTPALSTGAIGSSSTGVQAISNGLYLRQHSTTPLPQTQASLHATLDA